MSLRQFSPRPSRLRLPPRLKLSLLALLLAVPCAPPAAAAQSLDKRVDDYVRREMEKFQIPGLAIAVVREGRVVKLKGYGLASVEFEVPATGDSIFQIYSVTKIFAGVAVMKLVEGGRLSLDTPVTELFADLPPEWRAIRVRHLLTHTSGLSEVSANPRFAALSEAQRKQLTDADALRLVAEQPLRFAPGEKFSYHRFGYSLLGMIVEKASGRPFADFLRERVFAPTGMTSTTFGDSEKIVRGRSPTAYNRESGELRNWVYLFGARPNPGAGLNSTAADLARFMSALDAGRVLRRESLLEMWTPAQLNDGTRRDYGLGWTVEERGGRRVVGHEGGGSAWVAHFPAERLSVVVLCNLNGARADEIQHGIAELYLK